MHLESLSLRGFKSFERRVEIRFDRRLTAVVGPNGTGKSNIADAVRWVLGEQSMQALRSKNLVDLIFAGTDRRLPVNSAEVVLTVNNEDATLPVPYAQVAVTRRVYRAGESEFFINGIPCRLREIHQLFLDTGVGRRGVSVVGQGEIDALLTATPEQRRGWVEGLAGIARYQLQKQQTLAKAEAARQELTRLQDLIVEVRAQRDRLQAEALRARRHREMVARLRGAEWRLYLLARQAAEERVAGCRAEVDRWQQQLHEAQERHARCQTEARAAREHATALRAEIARGDQDDRMLQERAARLARDEGVLDVERRQAAERLRAGRLEVRRIRDQAAGRAAARRRAWRDRRAAARVLATAEARLAEAEAALAGSDAVAAVPAADLAALRARASALREELAALRAEERARAQQVQERHLEVAELERSLDVEEEALRGARGENARLAAEEERLRGEWTRREERLAAAEARLREAETAQTRAERELERLRARVGSLQQVIAEGQGYAAGPRLVLRERSRFPGLVGSVAELLRIPPELARATEAALGGAGQHLVTRDEEAVRAAIAWLKEGRRGRATFLPLERLRPAPALPPNHPARRRGGVIGVLAELVGIEEGFGVLLVYLFGRTLVLQDLDAALDLQRSPEMPGGPGARLVTLEGELLLPSGAVTGGTAHQEKAGLIATRSELSRLAEEERRVSLAAREAVAATEAARQAVREARLAREEAESAWREAAAARVSAEETIRRLERQTEALRARRAEARAVLARGEAEAAQVGTRARTTETAMEEALADLERAEEEASRREEALRAARERAETVLAAVGEARLARQEAAHRLQEATRRWEEARAGWVEWRAAAREASRRLQEAAAVEGLRHRRQALRVERQAVEAERARRRDDLAARRADLARAEEALALFEAEIAEAARGLETAREERHRAEVELVRAEAELNHLLADAPPPPAEGSAVTGAGAEAATAAEVSVAELERLREEVQRLRTGLARLGPVNPTAEEAFQEVDTRFRTLEEQRDDLIAARRELNEMVEAIDRTSTTRFQAAFAALQEAMQDLFQRLFDGGEARLDLTRPDDPLQSGVELSVRPPGKRWQPLIALSGGERSLCLVALLFSMQKVRPSAFALLDEVDAALDRRNLARFVSVLEEFSARTQFVLISHRPETVEAARVLYGATLDGDGTSRLVSLRVPETEEVAP